MIEDPSNRHIVRLRQDSYIAKNPIVNLPNGDIKVSLNFAGYLTPKQYPDSVGCAKEREEKVEANYMYGNHKTCVYGKLNKIPLVHYHEETSKLPYDFVFLKLNAISGEKFFVDLSGMNLLKGKKHKFFTSAYRIIGRPKDSIVKVHFLYLFTPRSEYIVEHKSVLQIFSRNFAEFILFILPAFCILFFNNDFRFGKVYWMQFGIVFDFVSNILWSFLDWLKLRHSFVPIYIALAITISIAYTQSMKKIPQVIKFWSVWVIFDYIMMALLMTDSFTVLYSILNVSIFFGVANIARRWKADIQLEELLVSFVISLSMLN